VTTTAKGCLRSLLCRHRTDHDHLDNATVCAAVDHGGKEAGQDQDARNAVDGEDKA
jgi:hypothetical protein